LKVKEGFMRARATLAALAASILVSAAVLAQASGEPAKTKSAARSGGSKLVEMPAADMKWMDLDPKGAPGVQIADVWGNHATGAFGAFIKFPAGFSAPLHTHTHDYKIVVVSGTFIQTPEGKPEFRLGPGSYEMQPGGSYRHTTACDKASDCLFFVQSTGKFDLKPVKAPASAPAKK
jgi:anti-sigma factor ChrR (cupin superfamily)